MRKNTSPFSLSPLPFRLSPFALCLLPFLIGCGGGKPPAAPVVVSGIAQTPTPQEPLPTDLRGAKLEEAIVEGFRKRVMGRRIALPDIERIVTEIAPIVEEAARQPSAQATFQRMAQDEGITAAEARIRWVALQEADLMLEAGGDADAVSVSDAVGVAQWLADTARGNGLPVNLRDSNRLTAKIDPLKRELAWLEYLLRPNADPTLPGAPAISPNVAAARLPNRRRTLTTLREKRRKIDARYDPRRAIFAQTRYLLRLYARFPSADWLFQAYHGGEGGATRTLKRYLGSAWPGSTAAAIRYGAKGRRLRFADVYLNTTPMTRPAAFSYLYGRSDDHRHYWWKLLACQRAIALFRQDRAAFQREWEALLPGRVREAIWYPNGPEEAFQDEKAITAALQAATLTDAHLLAWATDDGARRRGLLSTGLSALRPETFGLLRLIDKTYRSQGGKSPLLLGDTVLTPEESQRLELKRKLPPTRPPMPPAPDADMLPGGGPPEDFDYHTTGLAFDLLKPADARDRKILDYAIGYWEDRLVLARREKRDAGPPRWHLVPNPRYASALR